MKWYEPILALFVGGQVFVLYWLSGAEFERGSFLAEAYFSFLIITCGVFALTQIRNIK